MERYVKREEYYKAQVTQFLPHPKKRQQHVKSAKSSKNTRIYIAVSLNVKNNTSIVLQKI